jgi:hypothetical protein
MYVVNSGFVALKEAVSGVAREKPKHYFWKMYKELFLAQYNGLER